MNLRKLEELFAPPKPKILSLKDLEPETVFWFTETGYRDDVPFKVGKNCTVYHVDNNYNCGKQSGNIKVILAVRNAVGNWVKPE